MFSLNIGVPSSQLLPGLLISLPREVGSCRLNIRDKYMLRMSHVVILRRLRCLHESIKTVWHDGRERQAACGSEQTRRRKREKIRLGRTKDVIPDEYAETLQRGSYGEAETKRSLEQQ